MKTSLLVAAVAGLLFTQMLAAEENMTGKAAATSAGKPRSRAEEILQRFDLNRDGKLDEDEKADAHEVMMQEQMAKGAVPAINRELGPHVALALELFDRNGDSRLDENERLDSLAFIQQRTDGAMRAALLKQFDKNADGVLNETERAESQAYVAERRGELMYEVLLKRFDKNTNSQLEPDEKAAIREEFSQLAVKKAKDAPKPMDAAQKAALAAEIERRRAARKAKPSAGSTPAPDEKK